MAPPKGFPKPEGSGRKPGTLNREHADIKAAVIKALEYKGGWKYLAKQADDNPVAFLGLLSKILPMQVSAGANVLLIEQLCVVANNEWQEERAKAAAKMIDVTPNAPAREGNASNGNGVDSDSNGIASKAK